MISFGDASHQQVRDPLVNSERMIEQKETKVNFAFALLDIDGFAPINIDPTEYLDIGFETDAWFDEVQEDGSLLNNWSLTPLKTQKCTPDDIKNEFYQPLENFKDFAV